MNNSFYYFFSAVPQVLGGILALFGVFVIFKIQSLKSELFGICQRLTQTFDQLTLKELNVFKNAVSSVNLKDAIVRSDIEGLRSSLNLISTQINLVDVDYEKLWAKDHFLSKTRDELHAIQREREAFEKERSSLQPIREYLKLFSKVHASINDLIKSIIYWSVFTASIIIICLAVLPFGNLILEHVFILYTLFSLVIISIIISFYGLISILNRALYETKT